MGNQAELLEPLDVSLLELVSTWETETGGNLDAALELSHAQSDIKAEAATLQTPLHAAAAVLEASACANGRGLFVEAMHACGLLDEIMATSSHMDTPIGLTLLAPPDVALSALPEVSGALEPL